MSVGDCRDLTDLFVCCIGKRQGCDAHERAVAVVALAGATLAGAKGAGGRSSVVEDAINRVLVQLTNLSRMSSVSMRPSSLMESQVASVIDVSSLQVPAVCSCVP